MHCIYCMIGTVITVMILALVLSAMIVDIFLNNK